MPTELYLHPGGLYDVSIEVHDGDKKATYSGNNMKMQSIRLGSFRSGEVPKYEVVFRKDVWHPVPVKPKPLDCTVDRKTFRTRPVVYKLFRPDEDTLTVKQLANRYARKVGSDDGRDLLFEASDGRCYTVLPICNVTERREAAGRKPHMGYYVDGYNHVITHKEYQFLHIRFRDPHPVVPIPDNPTVRSTSYEALVGKTIQLPEWFPAKIKMVLPKGPKLPLGGVLAEVTGLGGR